MHIEDIGNIKNYMKNRGNGLGEGGRLKKGETFAMQKKFMVTNGVHLEQNCEVISNT